MMMSVAAFIKHWQKIVALDLGPVQAKIALGRAEAYVQKAKDAEESGRIRDMQPLFSVCNMDRDKIKEGHYFLEIRYHPVVDGHKMDRTAYTVAVHKPSDLPKSAKTQDLVDLMFAG